MSALPIFEIAAFIADTPGGFIISPVPLYLWARSPENGFAEKTAAGILILLVLLLSVNVPAMYVRKRFEARW